eukprot:PITA_36048
MIKLDLSKAYDRLSWNYLGKFLESFGFSRRWIDWIHSLISSPNFSILVNGTPSKTFTASRGIRQGDPLSPFLFILATEGLGRFIKKEREANRIKGLKLWGNNLPLTHQQFVDDIMLFGEPTVKEVKHLRRNLDLFVDASGLEINRDKSCVFIFNTVDQVKAHLIRLLGFRRGELPTKYLGNILDFTSKKMKNWQGVLDKLSNKKKKWALTSWSQLTERKEKGGLGLRDPEILNKVLGAKLWWRWLRGRNDLWKTIWKEKYNMPETAVEILRQRETPKGSSIWDLARLNRDLVEKNTFWEIRGGEEANFWEDKWHQKEILRSI